MKNNNWKIWIPIYGIYAVANDKIDFTSMSDTVYVGSTVYQALCTIIVIAVVLILLLA